MSDAYEKSENWQTLIIEDNGTDEEGYASGPERALMTALLFDGVQSYLAYAFARNDSQKGRYKEAFKWIQTDEGEYVFSFENVCEALGIDPNALRFGLANFINSNQLETEGEFRRSRRNF